MNYSSSFLKKEIFLLNFDNEISFFLFAQIFIRLNTKKIDSWLWNDQLSFILQHVYNKLHRGCGKHGRGDIFNRQT